MKFNFKKVFVAILIIITLPLAVISINKVLDLRKGASAIPANIFIDTQSPQGLVTSSLWRNLSQGGEEPKDMIGPVIPQLTKIKPELIRIDHIFDFYKIDQGNNNYDFSGLDKAVDSILATGAKPMLSLSYTPDSKAPADWNQWNNLVTATARHYSVDKKISGIYYEVWNEPDLFGGWHYGKDPNYTTLYVNSSRAVVAGAGTTNYKIGGPAITAYYNNCIKSLLKTASSQNLRLDFISWHKYTKSLDEFDKDFNDLNTIISDYPKFFNIERIISETGPNSDPDIWYDSPASGIHLISVATRMSGKIHRLFTFEPVDGPTARSDKSTGWGIIKHDGTVKPRYQALEFLNKLSGTRLSTEGNGSWVTSLASKNNSTIQILLVNYDPNSTHAETFPLTLQNLPIGKYQQTITKYLGNTSTKTIDTNGDYQQLIYLDPNTAQLIEITPVR